MSPLRHRAGWVRQSAGEWIEDGLVTVDEGKILSVEKAGKGSGPCLDHGLGVILSPLVNAHTHLSLSALKGRVDAEGGFTSWVRALMAARFALDHPTALVALKEAAEGMKSTGTGLVGEFGPHIPVGETLAAAGLKGIVWLEMLGNGPELPSLPEGVGGGITYSFAGHALHTTNPLFLRKVKAFDRALGLPFCVHLAESREETEFLATGKGEWADFLSALGMDFSEWDCGGKTPVRLAAELGLLDESTLAVHLLQVSPRDIETLKEKRVKVCLCPRSNLNLHGSLPGIERFLAAGLAPALGTDSLASVDSLDLFDEMRFVAERYPGLEPDTIIGMAVENGAAALGRGDLGFVRAGFRDPMIYVELDATSAEEAAGKLVHGEFGRVERL